MLASTVSTNLENHLEIRTRDGKRYFRSKTTSQEIGISPKEFGQHMKLLAETSDRFDIRIWSRRSHTWYVCPKGRS